MLLVLADRSNDETAVTLAGSYRGRLNAKTPWNLAQAVLGEGQLCPGVCALCHFCRAEKSMPMPERPQAMKSGSLKHFSCTAARIASSYLSPTSPLGQGRLGLSNNLGIT